MKTEAVERWSCLRGFSWKEMGCDIKIEARRWIARSLRAYGTHDYRADNRVADEKEKKETWGWWVDRMAARKNGDGDVQN